MRHYKRQGNSDYQRSVVSVLISFKTSLLTILLILATCGVIRSQEPVVVTTVNRPVQTVKKDTVPPPQVSKAVTVKDTTRNTRGQSNSYLDNIILKSNSVISYDRTSIGLGLGQDYGGVGGNILIYPGKNFGMFFGLGYNFAGVGYSLGLKSRIVLGTSNNHIALSALVMYGYNAVIIVENSKDLSRVFHGFTVGAGIDIRPWTSSDDYISLGLNIPFRSVEVQEYIDNLKNSYNVEFEHDLLPVTFSVGYRITVN